MQSLKHFIIILCSSYTDKELEFIRDMELRVQSLCKSPGFPEIMGYRAVSCTTENEGLEALRRLIVDLIET